MAATAVSGAAATPATTTASVGGDRCTPDPRDSRDAVGAGRTCARFACGVVSALSAARVPVAPPAAAMPLAVLRAGGRAPSAVVGGWIPCMAPVYFPACWKLVAVGTASPRAGSADANNAGASTFARANGLPSSDPTSGDSGTTSTCGVPLGDALPGLTEDPAPAAGAATAAGCGW